MACFYHNFPSRLIADSHCVPCFQAARIVPFQTLGSLLNDRGRDWASSLVLTRISAVLKSVADLEATEVSELILRVGLPVFPPGPSDFPLGGDFCLCLSTGKASSELCSLASLRLSLIFLSAPFVYPVTFVTLMESSVILGYTQAASGLASYPEIMHS